MRSAPRNRGGTHTRIAKHRAAWVVSLALHGAMIACFVGFVPTRTPPSTEPTFALTVEGLDFPSEPPELIVPVTVIEPPRSANPPSPEPQPEPQTAPSTLATPRRPNVLTVPSALSPAMTEFLRQRGESSEEPVQTVVDVVPVTAIEPRTPMVIPANGSGTAASREPAIPAVPRLHGELMAGHTVVYVLDCSGTMGLEGRFARACAALKATIANQPATVRVQVVTYNGRAAPLLPLNTPITTDTISAALGKLEPSGESRHVEGLRVAMKFSPSVIVFLSDADDAELIELRPLLAGLPKTTTVAASRITAHGIEPLRPLR